MSDETIMMEDGLQLSYLGKNANISDVIPTGHGFLASYVILRTSNIQQTNKQTNRLHHAIDISRRDTPKIEFPSPIDPALHGHIGRALASCRLFCGELLTKSCT